MQPDIHDYASAEAYLAGGRDKFRRPVENNTDLHRVPAGTYHTGSPYGGGKAFEVPLDGIAVRLHNTDIVIYQPDGSVVLNTGGWYTVTTKDRIHRYMGDAMREPDAGDLTISSDKGRWYFYRIVPSHEWHRFPNHPERDYQSGFDWLKTARFFDGARIQGGAVKNLPPLSETDEIEIAEDNLRKKIDRYIHGFIEALKEGIPAPGPGDCWYCLMRTDKGETLGDATSDTDHLLSHVSERYYVASLLWNAMRERRYGDPSFVLQMRIEDAGGSAWKLRAREDGKEVARDLRRYLKRRLLPSLSGQGPVANTNIEARGGMHR